MVAYSFQRRFAAKVERGEKCQTIRAVGGKRHARVGEMVQLYCGLRTGDPRKLGEGRVYEVSPIEIFADRVIVHAECKHTFVDKGVLDGLARADGFDGWDDMREFFPGEPWHGTLIRWELVTP